MRRRRRRYDPDRTPHEQDVTDVLLDAVTDGMAAYFELAPDGRDLDADERAQALAQVEVGALAILTAERERKLLRAIPTLPAYETLQGIRLVQQGLVLALADSPERRARAIDPQMIAEYWKVVLEEPWKAHLAETKAQVLSYMEKQRNA